MNPDVPLPDVAWTLLATAAVTAMVCLAAMWLVDNALLPALRGLLHPARPWLERRFPPTGDHRIKEASDAPVPGPGMRGGDPVRGAGVPPPLVPGAEGGPERGVRGVEEGRGRRDDSAPRGDEPRGRVDDPAEPGRPEPLPVLTGRHREPEFPDFPDDEETLAVFHQANEDELVPSHEPDLPAPEAVESAGSTGPGGDDPGPAEMGVISGASGDLLFPRPPAGPGNAPAGEDAPPVARHEPPAGASFRRLVWEARDTEQRLARARLVLAGAP